TGLEAPETGDLHLVTSLERLSDASAVGSEDGVHSLLCLGLAKIRPRGQLLSEFRFVHRGLLCKGGELQETQRQPPSASNSRTAVRLRQESFLLKTKVSARSYEPTESLGRELQAARDIAHAFLTARHPVEVYRLALGRVAPLVGASFGC